MANKSLVRPITRTSMYVSWATKAASASSPTPSDRLAALSRFYSSLTPSEILSEALAKHGASMHAATPSIARKLAQHTVVICVDTESHTLNTDQMTELGLAYIARRAARGLGNPGGHGFKLQQALRFFHFRVVEHAHLKSNRVDSRGPLGNRFGHTRFATFGELRVILHALFNQDVGGEDPELRGCKQPVILVGHALKHDTENANKKGLEYDIEANATVVAKVDTQALAREVGLWVPPANMRSNEIGLRVMIERLGFAHLDDHTACNDAARTMMCAIHMILPDNLRTCTYPTMQQVADRVEQLSRSTSPPVFGTEKCCTRCGGRDHSFDACSVLVRCAACDRFDAGGDRESAVASHIETYCPHVAKFKSWARRYRDAAAKKRKPAADIAAGPGDAHPWSTWPLSVKWPLQELDDVLVGYNMVSHDPRLSEPPAQVQNLSSALGGLPVPSSNGFAVKLPPATSPRPRSSTTNSSSSGNRPRSTTLGSSSSEYPPSPLRAGAIAVGSPTAAQSPTAARSPIAAASPTAASRARAPTTSTPGLARAAPRVEITMSEQRERARRAAEERAGRHGSFAGRGGRARKPNNGGFSGEDNTTGGGGDAWW